MAGQDKVKLTWGFVWMNVSQFLGALNDNLFRFVVVFFLIDLKGPGHTDMIMVLVSVVFVLPFLLFTAFAGVLADRISKRKIVLGVKVVEGLTMLTAAFVFTRESEWMVYGVLFMMTSQSAFFGPTKYGIIPELVGKHRLVKANSVIVLFTYLAIILGMGLAPALSELLTRNFVLIALICFGFSVVGFAATLLIDRTPPAGSDQKASILFVRDIWRTLYGLRTDTYLILAVMASAYFVLLAAFMQMNLIPYGMEELGLTEERSTYLFFLAALGIGVGAVLANRFSGRHIEFGLVPLGTLGVTFMMVALFAVGGHNLVSGVGAAAVIVLLMGIGAGLYVVPVEAFIQNRSPDASRGKILAAAGFVGWCGVLVASGIFYVLGELLNIPPTYRFLVMALVTLTLALVSFRVLPDFLIRFLIFTTTRALYRARVIGNTHVPLEGPVLLVSNHGSWLDMLLLTASQERPVRFLVSRKMYERRFLNPLFRLMGAIPIANAVNSDQVQAAFREVRRALNDGHVVCLYVDGVLERGGVLCEFNRGLEEISQDMDVPIVPVFFGGASGSIQNHFHGRSCVRRFIKRRYPVVVIYGEPRSSGTPVHQVRRAVSELSAEYFENRKSGRSPIGEELVRTLRSRWSRPAINDTTGKKMSAGKTLIATVLLADLMEPDIREEERIGVMLPSSVGGVLANLALALLRKVSVNLNYTVSEETRRVMIEQGGLRTVLTSRKFIEKAEWLSPPPGAVYLEDLLDRVTTGMKLRALFKARFMPRRRLARTRGFEADEILTVIYSSGSTAQPKGVMLSHHNILSNVEAFRMVYRPEPAENICAALPFFHSFGYTVTIWFPLLAGFTASYHTNPLEGTKIAEVVRDRRCTLLVATPTFLLNYIRKATREDFGSLRAVIAGAEKLKRSIADAFEQQFGIRPLEGYGVSELSPVVSANVPPIRIDGMETLTIRDGAVGRPLPGVAVQVVDPGSHEFLRLGENGMLLVKGPNVMRGYLDMPDKTEEAIRDGWYVTGDIAAVDADGFITITDRLTRFSKIGGEMVPHIAVEEAYLKGLNAMEPVLAVTSVPDEKKGERLVVLYTDAAGDPDDLHRIIKKSGLSKLWIPSRKDYYRIDEVPVLGSGKLDVQAVRNEAGKQMGEEHHKWGRWRKKHEREREETEE